MWDLGSCQSSRSPRGISKSAMNRARSDWGPARPPRKSPDAARLAGPGTPGRGASWRSCAAHRGKSRSDGRSPPGFGSWCQAPGAGCFKQVPAVEADLQLLPREPEGGLLLPGVQEWGGVGRRKRLPLGRREREPVENGGARASTCRQPDPSQAASQRCRKPGNAKTAVAACELLHRLEPWCKYTTQKHTPPFTSSLFFAPVFSRDVLEHPNHSEALQCKHYEHI